MKKRVLLLFVIILICQLWGFEIKKKPQIEHKRLRTEEQLASYIYSIADTLTFEFQDTYKADYTYNNNVLESVLVKQFLNNIWLEIEKYQYTYNNDLLQQELYQVYNNGWVNYQQENYSYDDADLLITYQQDYWNNDAWQPYLQITYTYDTEGLLIGEDWTYYSTAKEVDTIYNVSYEYNTQHSVIGELWTFSTDNITWTNYLKATYQRNENNSIISEDWQYWYSPIWISYLQYNHTYNENANIDYTEGLTLVDNQWQYYDNYQYYYNSNSNTSQLIAKLWDNDNQTWNNSYKYDYEYDSIVENIPNDVSALALNITTYPNPFTKEISFYSNSSLSKVEIYNLKGQKVYTKLLSTSKGKIRLPNISGLSNGVYLIRFEDSKGNFSIKKKVKLH